MYSISSLRGNIPRLPRGSSPSHPLDLPLSQTQIECHLLYHYTCIYPLRLLHNAMDCVNLDLFVANYSPNAHVLSSYLDIFWYIHIYFPTASLILFRNILLALTLHMSNSCQN